MTVRLPYFDSLLENIEGDAAIATAFGRHVHWGYWQKPRTATHDAAEFAAAAEQLAQEICAAGAVRDGQAVLDVGCGFGGTVASLNERYGGMSLTGLNIDARQLDRARSGVTAQDGNAVAFIEGSADKLPFPDQSFDVVLAVECIFHFPDRARFLAEAHRVLKPGGRLAMSDFVPAAWILPARWGRSGPGFFGDIDITCSLARYHQLARAARLRPVVERDVTRNTLPTYSFLRSLKMPTHGELGDGARETAVLWAVSLFRLLRYRILAFEKS